MKTHKLMFVLPNLFTVSSIFCGFYALTLCAGEAAPLQLYQAALAIFFGIFFDGFDGRVARLTKTQSDFGVELDSLADVITFGVAPAMLVYKWALHPLGLLGMMVAFSFAACGALRLARFNVLARRSMHGGGGRFFIGLPIPIAAAMIVSMVITHHATRGGPVGTHAAVPIALTVGLLSLLMVSKVRYRTFKDLRLTSKSAGTFVAMLTGGVLIATQMHPAYVLVAYFGMYLAVGLLESVLMLHRQLLSRKMASITGPEVVVEEEEEEEEGEEQDYL